MPVEPQPPPASRLLSADAPPHWRAGVLAGAMHGFFGRVGGISAGIYASLNAGTGSHDDATAVRENRRRIAAAFGAPPERLVGVHQVHSPTAVFVDGPWSGERPHADALVTTTPGLVISVLTADCAPVLLADDSAGVIAAAYIALRSAYAFSAAVKFRAERSRSARASASSADCGVSAIACVVSFVSASFAASLPGL